MVKEYEEGTVATRESLTMDVERRVYFVSEVAEILGVSRQTVLKYIKGGLVPGVRVGGRYLIMKDEFEAFLRSGGKRAGRGAVASEKPAPEPSSDSRSE
jgi:excisionase family DNA binding protein